ncbi:MAG: hypothetical protein PVH61_43475 [Candidatus Aminicenantes bacterium]|jgi:hypothetical protein
MPDFDLSHFSEEDLLLLRAKPIINLMGLDAFPFHLFQKSGLQAGESESSFLDDVCYTDYRVHHGEDLFSMSIDMLLLTNIELSITGLDAISFAFGREGYFPFKVSVEITPNSFYLNLSNLELEIRIRRDLLIPVEVDANHLPVKENNKFVEPEGGQRATISTVGSLILDTDFNISVEGFDSLSLSPCKLKDIPIALTFHNLKLDLSKQDSIPEILDAGFDHTFQGIYIESLGVYFEGVLGNILPDINASNFVLGTGGVSGSLSTDWGLVFDPATKQFSGDAVGSLFGIGLGLDKIEMQLRLSFPTAFSIKGQIYIPFFDAVFSAHFSLSNGSFDGDSSYKIFLNILKESADPIEVEYSELKFTLNQFNVGGFLSDTEFEIKGETGFAIDIFGFEIEAESTSLTYTHLDNRDDFSFTLTNVVLGELGAAEEAHLILKSHKNEPGEVIFDKIEIAANYTWQDLKGLIPPPMQDTLGLPEDGGIEALISWEEAKNQAGSLRKLVLRLKTQVSHLDNLWKFIPVQFRPEVKSVQSMFKISYDSVETFASKDAQGNPVPPPGSYSDRSGVIVELSALMEIKLPDVTNFNLPNFNLIRVDTGDAEGFISAEFKANYSSDTLTGESFRSGLTVQNPFSVDLILPGTDPEFPFIHNALDKVGFQFATSQVDDQAAEIGGKLFFEGVFEFRPLVPAAFPFAHHFNTLLRKVGLDEIIGRSSISLEFGTDSFDFEISGEFEQLGIEIDIFQLLSSLTNSSERPSGQAVDIDFDIGFHLIGFSFKVGENPGSQNADDKFTFSFSLKVECSMTGLPPLTAAITLSNKEFSFGLEDLTIPFEVPKYPISNADLDRLRGQNGVWTNSAREAYAAEIDARMAGLSSQIESPDISARERFRHTKDLAGLQLKKLMLELVMEIHKRVGTEGHQIFQGLVEADTWIHATVLNFLHFDTDVKLNFPEIKFRVPFDNPGGITISGSGRLIDFADKDPLKPLENYTFTLGLSSEYIFARIESGGEPIPIPAFGTKYDDGSVSISKFMIGYGYTKNSFAMDFAGELIIPSELRKDADTSGRLGIGFRLPRYNKLAFKIDLIPVTIVKVTVLIPIPQFDLDLRSPNAPALISTERCAPYWDGLEFLMRDVLHVDLKRLAFSPFFGLAVIPNIKYDGDLQLGDDSNGVTMIVDDLLILLGVMAGSYFMVIPFFADPGQPYFNNICVNLRALGFQINFNMQRPFPSASPLAALEAFGLISNPLMEIDPKGSLANTIRFTLSDAYLQVPEFVLQMFPEAANLVNRTYGFTLNLGTLITMVQSLLKVSEPFVKTISEFAQNQAQNLGTLLNALPNSFNPWDWIVLLPPELRKFRMGGQIAGFEASVCLVIATAEEARHALKNRQTKNKQLPMLNIVEKRDVSKSFVTYSKHKNHLHKPTSGYQFNTSWLAQGANESKWEKVTAGIAHRSSSNGKSFFVYQKTNIPAKFSISTGVLTMDKRPNAQAGLVFCYVNQDNHYLLKTFLNPSRKRVWVLEKKKSRSVSRLLEKVIRGPAQDAVHVELITYLHGSHRIIEVNQLIEKPIRGSAASDTTTYVMKIGRVQDSGVIETGKVGLYAKKNSEVHFSDMMVYGLSIKKNNFGKISDQSLRSGFNVNYPPSQLSDKRLITRNESLSLFKGLEFKKFNEDHLNLIPVEKVEHIKSGDASIYIGAYIKVFEGQRLRFLGRLFADGSFALVSEAEAKPLQLTVLGIPIKIPFTGYANLILVGRQKRNGFYGYVEANGYFQWVPLSNILRFEVGSKEKPTSLKLYSSGQFNLHAAAAVILFNGAGKIDAIVAITEQKAEFKGRLQFELGSTKPNYNFPRILALDIWGAGSIEGLNKYRFRGRGEVKFLGETFTQIEVDIDERYAYFDLYFRKPVNNVVTDFESKFPILTNCDIELNGSCKINLRKTVRPEFYLAGEGYIKALGAEIKGKGEIKSLPADNQSYKNDFFEVSMEGSLFWQGRKWLGGKFSVGSKGLCLSGTTNFGLSLTPKKLPGTEMNIANLFLNIQLEGEFRLDALKKSLYFEFKGSWTLGAAMADTGNENKQMIPLASSTFVFTSNIGLNTDNEYYLNLFRIDGFSFLPFKGISIPLPKITLSKKSDAVTILKAGKTQNNEPAVELFTPIDNIGLKGTLPFPSLYFGKINNWQTSSLKKLYSAYNVNFGISELDINFDDFSNVELSLVLEDDPNKKFPMKLKLKSDGGTKYISFWG